MSSSLRADEMEISSASPKRADAVRGLYVPPACLPEGGLSSREMWEWYLNVEREIEAGLVSPGASEYMRSYYREVGLLSPLKRAFFRQHFSETFRGASAFLLQKGGDSQAGKPKSKPVILDLGCGTGTQSLFFAACGAKVIAVDMDLVALDAFAERRALYECRAERALDITVLPGNTFSVDYAKFAPIDGVYSLFAFNMMQPSGELLDLISPHLAPAARLAVLDGNRWALVNRIFRDRKVAWTPGEFRTALRQRGFSVSQHGGVICLPPALWQLDSAVFVPALDRLLSKSWIFSISHHILAEKG